MTTEQPDRDAPHRGSRQLDPPHRDCALVQSWRPGRRRIGGLLRPVTATWTGLGALSGMEWSWRNGLLDVASIKRDQDKADDSASFPV